MVLHGKVVIVIEQNGRLESISQPQAWEKDVWHELVKIIKAYRESVKRIWMGAIRKGVGYNLSASLGSREGAQDRVYPGPYQLELVDVDDKQIETEF